MGYSVHIPLWIGILKIKSASRLRDSERHGRARVWRLGATRIVWSKGGDSRSPDQQKKNPGQTHRPE